MADRNEPEQYPVERPAEPDVQVNVDAPAADFPADPDVRPAPVDNENVGNDDKDKTSPPPRGG